MANGTYEDTFDTEATDEEEWENLIQLETARNNQQQVSRTQYLRERLRETSKEYVKQQAKQQAKKLAAKATKALARVIFQAIMQGLRMIVVFLVATPVGWVIDVAILAVILAIIVVANPGFLQGVIEHGCSGGWLGSQIGWYRNLNEMLCDIEGL